MVKLFLKVTARRKDPVVLPVSPLPDCHPFGNDNGWHTVLTHESKAEVRRPFSVSLRAVSTGLLFNGRNGLNLTCFAVFTKPSSFGSSDDATRGRYDAHGGRATMICAAVIIG
jgi:hypothetical protein